jgi:hypothetical protein
VWKGVRRRRRHEVCILIEQSLRLAHPYYRSNKPLEIDRSRSLVSTWQAIHGTPNDCTAATAAQG